MRRVERPGRVRLERQRVGLQFERQLVGVEFDADQLTFELQADALALEPYPSGSFDPAHFTGLFAG